MARRRVRLLTVLMASSLVLGACSQGGSASPSASETACEAGAASGTQIPEIVEGKFNIAMVLIGPHNDGGWSQAHYEGLVYVCGNIPDSHVAYVENVAEGTDSETTFRSLARKGFDLIIGTSFGYMNYMATVAEEFPSQTFLHVSGYKSNGKNFGNLMGAVEDMKYLAGMLAGSRAMKDGIPKLGYMATFAIPEELRLGNAFMLGAKKTCPDCTMDVRWLGTWHDPIKEKEAAASLFDAGADVVLTGADTPAVADVAQEKGKWGITYDYYGSCKVDHCLTTPYWIWGPEYLRIAKQVQAKTYTAGYEYFDADSGSIGLFGFMEGQTPQPGVKDLPEKDVQLVKDTLATMLKSSTARFDIVFVGPIVDNTGKTIVPAGEKMQQADLDQFPPGAEGNPCTYCMHWWADGVNAEIPAQ